MAVMLIAILSSPVYADFTGTITGTVVDKETGIPIPGAKVAINGDTIIYKSNLHGLFVINDLPASNFNLKANSIGYHDAWINAISLSSGETLSILFSMISSTIHGPYDTTSFNHNVGIIKGTVIDKQNRVPIGSAIIRIKNSNIEIETKNETGDYIIRNIPPGKYELQVSHPAYKDQSKIISMKAKMVKTLNFYLGEDK